MERKKMVRRYECRGGLGIKAAPGPAAVSSGGTCSFPRDAAVL